MRLYEITGQYAEVQARAEAGEDVGDALAHLDDALEQKGAALVRLVRDMELDGDKLKEELDRLAARKKTLDANVVRIREYLRASMANAGIHKIKAGTFSISLSDGPERVCVESEEAVPSDYQRIRREIDKAKILAVYKTHGELVPGTRIERSTRLVIR